jgi:hypothetical protein
MASKYQENERAKAVHLIKSENNVFYGAQAGKIFRKKERDFVLLDNVKNIFAPIRNKVLEYFDKNAILWWGGSYPTGHVLSSQIACINHLFQIREDKAAVMTILNNVSSDFVDVFEIKTDKHFPAYIQFEAVSDSDHLNEGQLIRGVNCTSVDALIYAQHKNGEKWLIPIEWKYTEFYTNQNKANEGFNADPINCKGVVRINRYTDLINKSNHLLNSVHFCYYFEPFYQLMRQTLWAEQMIKNKDNETLTANNFIHLHIIPENNYDLLRKVYKCSGLDMENTWRKHLRDQSKYLILSPEKLLKGIDSKKYNELLVYLKTRYQ